MAFLLHCAFHVSGSDDVRRGDSDLFTLMEEHRPLFEAVRKILTSHFSLPLPWIVLWSISLLCSANLYPQVSSFVNHFLRIPRQYHSLESGLSHLTTIVSLLQKECEASPLPLPPTSSGRLPPESFYLREINEEVMEFAKSFGRVYGSVLAEY